VALLALTWAGLAAAAAGAQPILLDRPVELSKAIAFPSIFDDTAWYYVAKEPRVATKPDGKPDFGFIQYVKNVPGQGDKNAAEEGVGGGFVTALVTLGLTDAELEQAREEVKRIVPGARLEGPVIFKSGTIAIVTAMQEGGGMVDKVVGMGPAPVLQDSKVPIAMALTKDGAVLMKNAFDMPTSQVSVNFNMEIEGYLSPIQAKVEAEWSDIYKHQSFNAGVAGNLGPVLLAAEIKQSFDELRKSNAIKIDMKGSDAQMEKVVETVYNKLLEAMFQPAGAGAGGNLAGAGGLAGLSPQQSLLDRASSSLQKGREEAKAENAEIRRENRADAAASASATGSSGASGSPTGSPPGSPPGTPPGSPGGSPPGSPGGAGGGGNANAGAGNVPLRARQQGVTAPGRVREEEAARTRPPAREEVSVPSLSVVAAFELKEVRQTGIFKLDFTKQLKDTRTNTFGGNIGGLRQYMKDPSFFRRINLDDPIYKQREILAIVDGLNGKDFGEYINFVSVSLRKQHQDGQQTLQEVRIDRDNFNKQGNAFRMLYGWKGDDDRSKWLQYAYKTSWSFFGGKSVDQDWTQGDANAIPLAPPYQRRFVALEGDAGDVKAAQVRSITVRVWYDLGGSPQMKQVTLNASKGELSDKIEFMLPRNAYDYDYEIEWRLRGNKTVSSGRKKSHDAILYVDELPAGAAAADAAGGGA
jgi:hypothetical protein